MLDTRDSLGFMLRKGIRKLRKSWYFLRTRRNIFHGQCVLLFFLCELLEKNTTEQFSKNERTSDVLSRSFPKKFCRTYTTEGGKFGGSIPPTNLLGPTLYKLKQQLLQQHLLLQIHNELAPTSLSRRSPCDVIYRSRLKQIDRKFLLSIFCNFETMRNTTFSLKPCLGGLQQQVSSINAWVVLHHWCRPHRKNIPVPMFEHNNNKNEPYFPVLQDKTCLNTASVVIMPCLTL